MGIALTADSTTERMCGGSCSNVFFQSSKIGGQTNKHEEINQQSTKMKKGRQKTKGALHGNCSVSMQDMCMVCMWGACRPVSMFEYLDVDGTPPETNKASHVHKKLPRQLEM